MAVDQSPLRPADCESPCSAWQAGHSSSPPPGLWEPESMPNGRRESPGHFLQRERGAPILRTRQVGAANLPSLARSPSACPAQRGENSSARERCQRQPGQRQRPVSMEKKRLVLLLNFGLKKRRAFFKPAHDFPL
uniref:Uncharacterized protein n=1 Tax=Myotis myotis TaxID=51298 RepID=A0A7J7S279_MYOMY|nr:hypothetical protein mMyoMyo1_010115 [Myotis myotis]